MTTTPAWARILPGLHRLRHYDRRWLRGDVIAGVTVAAYLVPQVMAYARLAGLPPTAGLWAALGPLAVYAVLGSSPQLSIGPESTTALLTAVAVAPLAAGDPGRYAALAAALALLVAGLCLVARVLRLGFLANLLSKPVLVGYLAGVAVLMAVGQLDGLTGVPVAGETLPQRLGSFVERAGSAHPQTLALGLLTLAFLLLAGRRWPRAPVPLIAVVLAAVAAAVLGLRARGVEVVGPVPQGLPAPGVPAVTRADLVALLLPAVGVTLVAFTDNVLTGRAFAVRHHDVVDADAELLALSGANAAAGILHGFPVSSSGSRTGIGDAVGSRSQLHSLVVLALLVATLLVLGPLLSGLPSAALGALVVYAAIRLVDVAEFRRIAAFRRSEVVLAGVTTVGVLAFDILYGVLVAVALSVLDLLRRVARPHAAVLGYAPGVAGMHDVEDYPHSRQVPGLLVYRYDSPLFFANAEDFTRRALAALDAAAEPPHWFVLNAEANTEVDLTSVDALEDLRSEVERRGIVFGLARVKQEVAADLRAAGLLARVGEGAVFPTLPTAVEAYLRWYAEHVGGLPPGVDVPGVPATPLAADPRQRRQGP